MMLTPEQLAALRAVPNSPRFTFHLDGCMAHAIVANIDAQAQQLNTQRIMIEAQLSVKGRIRDEASKRGRDASSSVSELEYLIELIDAQQARIAELEKDAARYRWLREFGYGLPRLGGELDTSIDAAMQPTWPEDTSDYGSRIAIVGQNGNDGLAYQEEQP